MKRVLNQEYFSKKQLLTLQTEGLKEIVSYVKANVPFYTKKYKHINQIKTLEDIRKLPIINRKEYLDAGEDVYSREFNYVKRELLQDRSTSGSTGSSFKIKYDERAWDYLEAIYARSFFSQKYNPFFKMSYYWHEPLKPKIHNKFGLFKRHYIPCTWSISKQIKELVKGNFKYIHYFSSSLYYISRIINEKDARKIRPKAFFTHAEILSPGMKKSIEKRFKTKVYDSYGTTEFIRMAWECPTCGTYHVCDDSVILEVLDENNQPCKPGQQGRFVLTGIANYVLPIIRYEMGDYGCISKKKNTCRRAFTSLDGIEGRDQDFLVDLTGVKIPPKKVIDAFGEIEELAIFKVIQETKTKVRVIAHPKKGFEIPKSKIEKTLRQLLGKGISFQIKKGLPKFGKRGKLRLVENKCP